jgi:RimJ/RimL family protein N-acetyltransferase
MRELQTSRLTLPVFSLNLLRAAACQDLDYIARMLRARVAPGWPSEDLLGALPIMIAAVEYEPALEEWCVLVLTREERVLIGDIGFKTLPDARGEVEIGYGLVPPFWGLGLATEAAQTMIAWAFSQPKVQRVTANCLPDNQGSIRVLQKCGLRITHQDAEGLWWARDKMPHETNF